MSETSNNETINKIRFARQELDKERAHRREKVWKIFSWAATILVAITGGVIALKTDPTKGFVFPWWLRALLSGSILSLMGFACLWIEQNLNILRDTEEAIAIYDKQLDIKKVVPSEKPKLGYKYALVMITIAAIIVILIDVS